MDDPMSGRPGIVLCAPAAIRHDPLPGASISVHVLPGCADDIQAGANTIIVPARLVPAATPDPAGQSSLQPVFLLWPAGQGSWLAYTLMSYTGDDLLVLGLDGRLLLIHHVKSGLWLPTRRSHRAR